MSRGQTSLPSVAIALSVLIAVTAVSLAVSEGAIAGADREAEERRAAVSLAAGLVADHSVITERRNVVNGSALDGMDGGDLRTAFPVADAWNVTVRVDDRHIASTGDASGGTTVRRLVAVERYDERTLTPDLGWQRRLTLPRRTGTATIELSPSRGTIRTVRANERVVLHDPDGLDGTYEVSLSRFETTTLRLDADGQLRSDAIRIRYRARGTRKAVLAVTVDG